jgi:hypothetical protein
MLGLVSCSFTFQMIWFHTENLPHYPRNVSNRNIFFIFFSLATVLTSSKD